MHAGRGFNVEALQLNMAVETGAELADDPFAGAIVDMASTKVDEEGETDAEAEQDPEGVRPKAKLMLIRWFQFK